MSNNKKIEERGGVLIIFFVAIFAMLRVVNSTLEDKITTANNQQVKYSDWYNAKSIKQVMKENENVYLKALFDTGMVEPEHSAVLQTKIQTTSALIAKYESEKTEILLGSANIPKYSWTQDLNGEMGKIIGLQEWEKISNANLKSVAKIDLGLLFIEISILFGLVLIIIHDNVKLQNVFTILMVVTGLVGIAISFYGFALSL